MRNLSYDPSHLDEISILVFDPQSPILRRSLGAHESNTAGFFLPRHNLVGILNDNAPRHPELLIRIASTAHHELGHAAGTNEVRLHFSRNGSGLHLNSTSRVGYTRVGGDGELKGSLIEEGLAIMDEVDFYRDTTSKVVSRDFDNEQLEQISAIREDVNNSPFGPVSKEDFGNFVWKNPNGVVVCDLRIIGVYQATTSLARLIGSSLLQEVKGGLSSWPDSSRVDLGRKMLDSGRFENSLINLRGLTGALGNPRIAKVLLEMPAWPDLESVLWAKRIVEVAGEAKGLLV